MHNTATYDIVAINSTVQLKLKSHSKYQTAQLSRGALDLKSKGRWFEPAVNHNFSSNYVRLLAHIFTDEDLKSE